MSLEVIYVTRHGFRSNWVVEPKTGTYSTSIPSPTGIASDPALAGYGVEQSHELSTHLQTLSPPIERFYTSPFYRCIQTISPAVEAIAKTASDPETCKIRGENGVGEWYGMARFDHPSPATPGVLKKLFERYDESYEAEIKPSVNGETIDELHDRTAYALHRLIEKSDREGVKAILICTHAATLIAIGRALTGRMPEDTAEEDFRPFTCGVSTFVRKNKEAKVEVPAWEGPETKIPHVEWRGGNGVGGGWEITKSGDCSFLSGGEERGWRFSGDESFVAKAGEGPALDAGSGLGVVIEGNKSSSNPSRL
ncbi:Phosphoglycerate mutase-like protein [Glarea lozoyensis ATCC 20868]|uniref:Phosphoglycerate mutase-like protein n=1 Tax=Glarea lozoyensis (strain ATCC 20868 / MF5171) TaxID=1116229 RepID=S3DW60_GLAL2|nr:Phosphoglycerate mutase-like protein [Glarea lozoyensis ATCC 20868]EPE36186.1 Phosphoglycerate mutase-like protein [Glarea lozoyensis ATCC 20868]